jgi:hypothetical protein
VQVAPLTVTDAFASAELGIDEAATDRVGVVVDVATLGTSHDGQLPLLAIKFVTLPDPDPEPVKVQVVPVQLPAPEEKLKVKAPDTLLIVETTAEEDALPFN